MTECKRCGTHFKTRFGVEYEFCEKCSEAFQTPMPRDATGPN